MPSIQIPTGTGVSFTATTSTDLQTAFLNLILQQALNTPASDQTVYTPNLAQPRQSIALRAPVAIDLPYGVDTITGGAAVPQAQVILAAVGGTYVTGTTQVSTVVAADYAQSTIINNNNGGGGLIAVTGAGQNTLEGLAGANQFITGNGGVDNVVLDGGANALTSNGTDTVQVGGTATISAAAGGSDAITMLAGVPLAFVNQSASATPSSVTAVSGAIVDLAGPGSTSITAGAGTEYFFVDTSAGNTTLTGNPYANDAFTFVKDANNATANIVVANLGSGDLVAIHGYSTYSVQASTTVPGSAVLLLGDGSQVTFAGVSAAAVQTVLRLE